MLSWSTHSRTGGKLLLDKTKHYWAGLRGGVEGLIENADDHRLPLEQAIDIAKETCRGLEFAHSQGMFVGRQRKMDRHVRGLHTNAK